MPAFRWSGSIIQYAKLAILAASIPGINAIMILEFASNLTLATKLLSAIYIPEVLCYGDSRLFCTNNGRASVFGVDFRAGQRFRIH